MSEKSATLLHNSDLFLNSLTNTWNGSGIDNGTTSILRKGETVIKKNNHFIPLRTSYLLPPLHSSLYFHYYPSIKQKIAIRAKQSVLTPSLAANRKVCSTSIADTKGNRNTCIPNKNHFVDLVQGKNTLFLQYQLRSLTPRGRAKMKARKERYARGPYLLKEEPFTLDPPKSGRDFQCNDALLPEREPQTWRERVGFFVPSVFHFRSSISREFFLITIHLILLTVLAVAQRSPRGNVSSVTSKKPFYTLLCESKLPNGTPSYLNRTGTYESNVHKVNAKALLCSQKLGRYFAWLRSAQNGLFVLPKQNKVFLCTANRFTISDENAIQAFSYYLPFYTSQTRLFSETDTIPSKRSSVLSKWRANENGEQKNDVFLYSGKDIALQKQNLIAFRRSNPCTDASYSLLETFFYKYGFLIVSPSKKIEKSQTFKEQTNKNLLDRSVRTTRMEIRSPLSITDDSTDDQHILRESSPTPDTPIVSKANLLNIENGVSENGSLKNTNSLSERKEHYSTIPQETGDTIRGVEQGSVFVNNVAFVLHKNIATPQTFVPLFDRTNTKGTHKNKIFATSANKEFNTCFTLLQRSEISTLFRTSHSLDYDHVYSPSNVNQTFVLLQRTPFLFKQRHAPVFTTNKKRLHSSNAIVKQGDTGFHSQIDNQLKSIGFHNSRLLKTFLPSINKPEFDRYSCILNGIENRDQFYKKNTSKSRDFFPLGFVWSRFDLRDLRVGASPQEMRSSSIFDRYKKRSRKDNVFFSKGNELVSQGKRLLSKRHTNPSTTFQRFRFTVQDVVPVFGFVPDSLVKNHSVSGYLFPELQQREIAYLFRKRALFLHTEQVNRKDNQTVLRQWFDSLRTPFRLFNSSDLLGQVISTPYLINHDRVVPYAKQAFTPSSTLIDKATLRPETVAMQRVFSKDAPSFIDDAKMRYTHVHLNELENVKAIFKKLGQDYDAYVCRPKDSLPALIISPSLEDDREIEEEGIRIFRTRDFVKNKKSNLEQQNEQNDPLLFLSSTSPDISENQNISTRSGSNEMQNHQLLVKNALQQAQEEIDKISKKEENSSEKDKSVIPPLTRLEALYTIRHREKKRELAKEFTSMKDTVSHLSLKNAKLSLSKQKSLPIFDELFLYSDNTNDHDSSSIFTPWLFAKLGDKNVSTDRKHSFWGEMGLSSKKLTAQEQKLIFQQKADPLLKEKSKNSHFTCPEIENHQNEGGARKPRGFEENVQKHKAKTYSFDPLSDLAISKNSRMDYHNLDWRNCFATVPSSLFSQFSVLHNEDYKKNAHVRFQVGSEHHLKSVLDKNRIYFYDNLSQNKPCQGSTPKIKGTVLESPVLHRVWQPKRMEVSTFRVSPRDNSTPVIPKISQKEWRNIIEWQLQKYFVEEDKRLLPLSVNNNKKLKIKKVNLYLPWVSIKKAVDLFNNQDQAFHTTKDSKPFSKNNGIKTTLLSDSCSDFIESGGQSSVWPLTSLDRIRNKSKTNHLVQKPSWVNEGGDHSQTTRYWKLPIQKNIHTLHLAVKRVTTNPEPEIKRGIKQGLSFQTTDTKQNPRFVTEDSSRSGGARLLPGSRSHSKVVAAKTKRGVCKNVFNDLILFEGFTKYSWLFISTFVLVFMFRQIFTLVYTVALKTFFIHFLNSEFCRTITSEEFRYSIQNAPLTELYRPKRELNGLLGLERNKVQLLEIVWFLRNKCQGRHGPRGVLLVGPPGVESVAVVQAIAGQAGVPIMVQSLEKIAQDNEPQRQLEQLYMRAQKNAPCVLFLDKLDTVGARRDQILTGTVHRGDKNAHTGRNNTSTYNYSAQRQASSSRTENENETVKPVTSGNKLNVMLRLLTILDGITQSNGVVTVATAQDLTKLDPALLRPKRFDRKIYLSLPNQQDRVDLFKVETQSIGHSKDMPWDYLSLQTESMSAVDIRSAINYSLFRAVLKNSVHTVETLRYGVDCVKTLTSKRSLP